MSQFISPLFIVFSILPISNDRRFILVSYRIIIIPINVVSEFREKCVTLNCLFFLSESETEQNN
jgi:hypothetical protein